MGAGDVSAVFFIGFFAMIIVSVICLTVRDYAEYKYGNKDMHKK